MLKYTWIEGKDKDRIPVIITVGSIKNKAKEFNIKYEKVQQLYEYGNIMFHDFESRIIKKKFNIIKDYEIFDWKNNRDEIKFLDIIVKLSVLLDDLEEIIIEASNRSKNNKSYSKPNEI